MFEPFNSSVGVKKSKALVSSFDVTNATLKKANLFKLAISILKILFCDSII